MKSGQGYGDDSLVEEFNFRLNLLDCIRTSALKIPPANRHRRGGQWKINGEHVTAGTMVALKLNRVGITILGFHRNLIPFLDWNHYIATGIRGGMMDRVLQAR